MTKMRRLASAATDRLGRRGAALLWFGLLDLVIGASMLDPGSLPKGAALTAYRAVLDVAPFWVWGLLWVGVAGVCFFEAWRKNDRLAFGLAIAIKVAWAACMAGSWLFYGADRAWLGVAVWGSFAMFVALIAGWPEPVDHRWHRR